jgi:Spy/CpxP family protein refolding chaperone
VKRPLVFLLGVALPVAALAQAPEEPRRSPGRQREEGARMIEAYIVSNLQESLALTDDQFVKVLPLVKKLQTERREYAQGRMRLLRQMRRALESGSATEGQVTDLLNELKALDAEGPARNRKNLAAVDAVLTPLQQAKLRILEVEVERKLREILSEIRGRRSPGHRGKEPSPEEP